jgi:hypothetical protein
VEVEVEVEGIAADVIFVSSLEADEGLHGCGWRQRVDACMYVCVCMGLTTRWT